MSEVTIEKKKLEELEEKASFLEDILEMIEDRKLGRLMRETEEEKNISLSRAKTLLIK